MRSYLTTLFAAAFLCAGTGVAIAFVGGGHVALEAGASASCEQYRPGNGFGDQNHCHTGPPGQTGEHPASPPAAPPASHVAAATASVSRHGGATVHCPFACNIVLRVRHGRRHAHTSARLRHSGTTTVHLSRRALKALGKGPAEVIVEVNGKVVSTRKLRLV